MPKPLDRGSIVQYYDLSMCFVFRHRETNYNTTLGDRALRSGTERFGAELKKMREREGLGLRELARRTGISPAFLSKVEAGKEKPPSEAKIRALAKALSCNEEMMLARACRLPPDVMKAIQKHPCEYFSLIRASKGLSAEQLGEVQEQLSRRGKI
jgi:DNA-binding transcriptional regulator YiaG